MLVVDVGTPHNLAASVRQPCALCKSGLVDPQTIIFWFFCNSLLVVAHKFVFNLRLSGQFPEIEVIYDFLELSEVRSK